jgi:hypothetical protein
LLVVAGAILLVPLSIRAANRLALDTVPGPGYLPSLEQRRTHQPFNQGFVEELRYGQPRWVFIGDSMLGTRIDPRYLGQIATTGNDRALAVMAPASGPAWWYLAFKNVVVRSGVKPRWTFIFFRDTNLTDTMFRLESQYGHLLDMVADEYEPELDALVWARRRGLWAHVHRAANRVFELDVARLWMEPAIREWFTRYRYRSEPARLAYTVRMEEFFSLDRLRRDVASDLGATVVPDFDRELPTSVLPLLMRLSREHGLPLCFVRVQRRPEGNQPPEQSPELREYIRKLASWIQANGGLFHDDTGDPEMTLDLYEDGDHFGDRKRYTEIFRARLDPLFRPEPSVDEP